MGMTVAEFEAQQQTLSCQHCRYVPLALERNANNNGLRPICPACDSRTPIPNVQWLSQQEAYDRRPKRPSGDPTVEEVWEANGNHCAHCGLSAQQIEFLGIGKTKQHVVPFKDEGKDGPLIPLCAWCQQDSAAQMKRLTALIARLVDKLSMP